MTRPTILPGDPKSAEAVHVLSGTFPAATIHGFTGGARAELPDFHLTAQGYPARGWRCQVTIAGAPFGCGSGDDLPEALVRARESAAERLRALADRVQ